MYISVSVYQCCQVAEISAKKVKRGRGKIKLAGRIGGRIFGGILLKGAEEYFLKKFPLNVADKLSEAKKNFNFVSN
jgi:hypothetical protein